MLSRPPTPHAIDRLVKVTLLATLTSLGVHGGLLIAHTADTCEISTAGLDAQSKLFVARRVLACNDYEHGRITKDEYHRTIDALDLPRPVPNVDRVTWASYVLASSTQYSDEAWSAQQALGAPNVYPRNGDIAQAWASKTADGQDEWIELGYEHPRAVSAVEIYETFNPGAVTTVELITTSGRRIELRPASPINDQRPLSNKTTIATPCTSEPIAAVRVNVASTSVEGWNEIDAVGLVGCIRE